MEHSSSIPGTKTRAAGHARTTGHAHTAGGTKRRGVEWSTGKPLEVAPTAFASEGKLVVDVLPADETLLSKELDDDSHATYGEYPNF